MSNGHNYTENHADIREFMARFDERQKHIQDDVAEIKANGHEAAAHLAALDDRATKLETRQKGVLGVMAGFGGVGLGLVGTWLQRLF